VAAMPFYYLKKQKMNLYIEKYCSLKFKDSAAMTEYYRSMRVDYPKFFKMDNLSKLGFLASETIFEHAAERFVEREDVAVLCFNRSSSLDVDRQYQATIADNENYFPLPSLFVHTLPNIAAGELAIRNRFLGETSFYIAPYFDAQQMTEMVENSFLDIYTNAVLMAWIECFDGIMEVFMCYVGKDAQKNITFTKENIVELKNKTL
jgi:3-oxoacyl-[acyl-carrier-protein] synthase-1